MSNKTRVTRSWSSTWKLATGGVVCTVLAAYLFVFEVEGPITLGFALLVSIVAFTLLYTAAMKSSSLACPGCGTNFYEYSKGDNDGLCCGHCHRYVEGKDGEVWLTDPARVAATPLFRALIDERSTWPDGCCVCGRPATRNLPPALDFKTEAQKAFVAGGLPLYPGGGTRRPVEVPHCGNHEGGASLGPAPSSEDVTIAFRSYAYLRAFCEKNQTHPR